MLRFVGWVGVHPKTYPDSFDYLKYAAKPFFKLDRKNQDKADKVYEGTTPLVADDVADCIAWAVTRPSHVNIDQIVVKPRDQARAQRVFRRSRSGET